LSNAALKEPPVAPVQPPKFSVDMKYLVRALVKYNASDLHLKPGRPPLFRINGKLIPAKMPELEAFQVERIVMDILTSRQKVELEEDRNIDLSFVVQGLGRFRCHIYFQKNCIAAAVRAIPLTVPSLDQLGIPEVMRELCQRPRGLLLVTGATGGGKSTTLAALVNYINETSAIHILCIEDPIEYLHRDLKGTVTQREVGTDTLSLEDALYSGLRQDPDVIVIGELRDYEMIQAALSAAETGHLVLATLHTNDARSTVDRIVEVFPPEAKNQARIQLSAALVGVLSQQLLERADGSGRVPACEVMVKSPTIENYILKNELEKIPDAIATSNLYYKMQTMNQALERLVKEGKITADQALKASSSNSDLKLSLSGLVRQEGYEIASKFQEQKFQDQLQESGPIELEGDKTGT
jgi:twitching motility protein PilT